MEKSFHEMRSNAKSIFYKKLPSAKYSEMAIASLVKLHEMDTKDQIKQEKEQFENKFGKWDDKNYEEILQFLNTNPEINECMDKQYFQKKK